jgi:DNA helicase II / ATP-dependent DNA helicase PcrA
MTPELSAALERLSPTQRQAADWGEGPALVLAGPGVGKTTVLTARIARILDGARNRNFRVLALTFTTKAGDEMRTRVEELVPGLTERTVIGTFHSFCAQILRQHGSHLQIKPDFGVYDQDADRMELLKDALREAAGRGNAVNESDVRWLGVIDQLRSSIIGPKKTAERFRNPADGERIARVYEIYEEALQQRNVMDFNGLILNACRLAHQMPSVAARVRQSYPYWLIDEFQDTTPAQYRLVRFLAGDAFKNVFAVADDDQIIYQWAGASYQQIVKFRQNFEPALFQLVENRRCPPEIVQAANNLIVHNSDRTPGKAALVATKANDGSAISFRSFPDDASEAQGIAAEIASAERGTWKKSAVLARTRAMLVPVLAALQAAGVKAAIATRRDRFMSPQFVWLQACLDQSIRPNDTRVFTAMVDAANRIAELEGDDRLQAQLLIAEAEAVGHGYMEQWAGEASGRNNDTLTRLAKLAQRLIESRSAWKKVMAEALTWLPTTAGAVEGVVTDASDDKAAWENAARAIRSEMGADVDLPELLQGIALRPKEPPQDPDAVGLYTIHASKGLEFDQVWVAGLAESVLPSWQSLKPDARPAELEEERRNCFVAITRARKSVVLTCASTYQGRTKEVSRFVSEMGVEL